MSKPTKKTKKPKEVILQGMLTKKENCLKAPKNKIYSKPKYSVLYYHILTFRLWKKRYVKFYFTHTSSGSLPSFNTTVLYSNKYNYIPYHWDIKASNKC